MKPKSLKKKALCLILSAALVFTGAQAFADKTEEMETRGEFAIGIAALLDGVTVAAPQEPSFTDVAADSACYKAVELLASEEIGAIKGRGDGLFCPDEEITFNDALNMLGRIFAPAGNLPGGYPYAGYELCSWLDFTLELGFSSTDMLTKDKAALLFERAAEQKEHFWVNRPQPKTELPQIEGDVLFLPEASRESRLSIPPRESYWLDYAIIPTNAYTNMYIDFDMDKDTSFSVEIFKDGQEEPVYSRLDSYYSAGSGVSGGAIYELPIIGTDIDSMEVYRIKITSTSSGINGKMTVYGK